MQKYTFGFSDYYNYICVDCNIFFLKKTTKTIGNFIRFLVVCIGAILLCGCEDNRGKLIWDIIPLTYEISVVDSRGNNLLNEDTEGNILSDNIKAVYNGVEYLLGDDASKQESRALPTTFRELFLSSTNNGWNADSGENKLYFGEFTGEESQDVEFVIDWGDGTTDTFRLTRDCEWKNGDPVFTNTALYLNAEKVSDDVFSTITIVR